MPLLASDEKPMRLGDGKTVRLSSNKYAGQSKKNYDEGYDRIFGGKKEDDSTKQSSAKCKNN